MRWHNRCFRASIVLIFDLLIRHVLCINIQNLLVEIIKNSSEMLKIVMLSAYLLCVLNV